jgi:FKBP-type peptidyl-prolyl cis-trans isomerase
MVVLLLQGCVAKPAKSAKVTLKTQQDSISYLLGWDVGEQLKGFGADIQMDIFAAAVQEALAQQPSRISPPAADSLRAAFAAKAQQHMEQQQQMQAQQGAEQSKQFLERNRKRKEVKVTESGLQYEVITEGSGPTPKPTDSVTVTYRGMLLDSTVFDSTSAQNPAVFDLQRIIPGLQQGIGLMKVGATYRFYLSPQLAYGEQGAAPVIPPNAALIFELTLIGIGAQQGSGDSLKSGASGG